MAGLDNGYISLWDGNFGKKYNSHIAHKEPITAIKISKCGKYYLSTAKDNSVILWSVKLNTALRKFFHPRKITSIEFSPNGKLILTGSVDGIARLYDTQSGEL